MIVVGPDFRVPPDLGLLQLVFIVLALQAIENYDREFPGATITLTSWYRDAMRNAQVGGVMGSLHTMGLALDTTVSRPLLPSIACGVGSIFGLCREPPVFAYSNSFRRIAPPLTQALQEPNGSFHFELDLTP